MSTMFYKNSGNKKDIDVSADMQRSQGPDHRVTIERLASPPEPQFGYCICRVPDELRTVNEQAYDPVILAIGPYHHGKETLKMMEEHKLRYLNSLLRRSEAKKAAIFETVEPLEERARKCYAEPPELDSRKFIDMLVLDGCFIVELLRKFSKPDLIDNNDPIFKSDLKRLQRDLMLFENQIPFFILFELFNLTGDPTQATEFAEIVVRFFYDLLPGDGHLRRAEENCPDQTKHLLGMLHDNWLPKFAGCLQPPVNWKPIRSATELREFGVNFVKADNGSCLLDISFKNGTMQIPSLIIEDRTECFFRNLIAYELHWLPIDHGHVISYAKFFDCLIDSAKDVDMLRRYGIIDNRLSKAEAVSEIFKKINGPVTHPSSRFHYAIIFNDVDKHCNHWFNRRMSDLWPKYLSNPWRVISILLSLTTLVLAFNQTIYMHCLSSGKQ